MIERSHQIFCLQDAAKRDIDSLRNWTIGTGCIARKEIGFLDKVGDLANLMGPRDNAIATFEPGVEMLLMKLCHWFGMVGSTLPASSALNSLEASVKDSGRRALVSVEHFQADKRHHPAP